MATTRRNEIAVGLLLAAGMVVLGYMAIQVGSFQGFGPRLRVSVAFDDVSGLERGAAVSQAGVPVGRVEAFHLDGERARVILALEPEVPVHKDARAAIRARSVLGEKYIALIPGEGGAARVASGDVLQSMGRRVEIDDVVNAMGPMIEAVDPDALAAALGAVAAAIEDDPERLARMLANADVTLGNVAEASAALPDLSREALSAVREARGAVHEVDARAREARSLLTKADAALDAVGTAADAAPALVAEAEAAVRDARAAMAKLDAATDTLQVVLDNFAELDKWEIRRLLREEGVLVRIRAREVVPDDEE